VEHESHDELAILEQELREQLRPTGQQGVLRFWNELSPLQKMTLATQLAQFDPAVVQRLHREKHQPENWRDVVARAEPPQAFRLGQPNPFTLEQAQAAGRSALAAGRVAAILVAGGQGSRLGFEYPKGMYPVGPVSGATLFQILFEKLLAVGRRYGVPIPLFLMTSPATHDETVDYLQQHDRFGLRAEDLIIHPQGTMPAVDEQTGALLLAHKGHLSLSPDGHGGVLAAMVSARAFEKFAWRGIQHLFYFQVDNPLAPVCDPAFIGYHVLSNAQISTLAVAKHDARDPVGNIVTIEGRQQIVEYSEFNHLEDEIIAQRDPQGRLRFWAGNTAIHVFDAEFLKRMASNGGQLPFHVARKRVPYLDESGQLVEPREPNALKFERFIFDLLPAAERAIVVETDERHTFAPLKNPPGAAKDSPESVRAQMIALHQHWLREAGAVVEPATPVEISPIFALDASELPARVPAGTRITAPTYLR
jgi:UDP-N-acetylglucosamine/UDP-N-acetylgalactosamine diphosphorylase